MHKHTVADMVYRKIRTRLSALDGRTLTVVKNTAATAVMKAGVLACSLIMVPITLDYLNAENYGIWMAMKISLRALQKSSQSITPENGFQ